MGRLTSPDLIISQYTHMSTHHHNHSFQLKENLKNVSESNSG